MVVQAADEHGDLRFTAAAGVWPLIYMVPPVLPRGPRVPGQKVNVQVLHLIADHGRIHMLGTGHLAQCPAGTGAPPAHCPCFRVGQGSSQGESKSRNRDDLEAVMLAARQGLVPLVLLASPARVCCKCPAGSPLGVRGGRPVWLTASF